MNHPSQPPFRHLTSVDLGKPVGPDPAALNRALWQQRCSIQGAYSRADYLRHTNHRADQQRALAEELQRLASEAFALAEILEGEG